MGYNWLYTSWNDNEYILFLIAIILTFIIINFGLWKRKKNAFDNITQPLVTDPLSIHTLPAPYQPPIITNPINNLFISDQEKANWNKAWVQLDGNEETISNISIPSSSSNIITQNDITQNDITQNDITQNDITQNDITQNDITQINSTLYNINQHTSNNSVESNVNSGMNYNILGNYATIDNLGKSMTDTLGGIKSNLGYTLLQEQLGTFKPNYTNNNTYDNTKTYKTGMNPSTVDGTTYGSGNNYQLVGKNKPPIIMQKDFAGVANIFAPNIYISNPPLTSDGYPDISYSM